MKTRKHWTEFAPISQPSSIFENSVDVHARSELVLNLIDSYPGDFLRVALEKMSMQKEIEPLYLMYNQFIGRTNQYATQGFLRLSKDAARGRGYHAHGKSDDRI